ANEIPGCRRVLARQLRPHIPHTPKDILLFQSRFGTRLMQSAVSRLRSYGITTNRQPTSRRATRAAPRISVNGRRKRDREGCLSDGYKVVASPTGFEPVFWP